jgi:nitroimidazol reductase NimA-like FMN-containing flavoprotein (pyridoxamine 5'-phosphate oxidase superfamily)
MSFQFIPPPKPPFPEVRRREFQSSGRKRPKLNEELDEERTLTDMAHSAGRPVSFTGNSGEGSAKEPLAGTETAYESVACEGRIEEKAEAVHSRAWFEVLLSPKAKRRDWRDCIVTGNLAKLLTTSTFQGR